jgi:hypothetical protein
VARLKEGKRGKEEGRRKKEEGKMRKKRRKIVVSFFIIKNQ